MRTKAEQIFRSSLEYPTLLYCLLFLFWTGAIFFAPTSILWRDSGEFVLSALYLDIAHPAGFPIYAQLANFLTLLPLGPPAFRVHLFSCFIAAIILYLVSHLLDAHKNENKLAVTVSLALLVSTPVFLKQTFSAEVYSLHAVFVLTLLVLYRNFLRTQDLRYIVLCAFIGGLGLANHVALGLTLLWFIPLVLSHGRPIKKALIPSFLVGLVGLAVYLFLPLRALNSLSLSTGEPSNLTRFISHISNARDLVLRPAASQIDPSLVSSVAASPSYLQTFLADLPRLAMVSGLLVFILALIGGSKLAVTTPRLFIAGFGAFATNLLFFSGWDPDPWLISVTLIVIGFGLSVPTLQLRFQSSKRTVSFFLLGTLALSLFFNFSELLAAAQLRTWNIPRTTATALFQRLPAATPFLSEASYFVLKYFRDAEGYRSDIPIVYQPGLLFPQYFRPIRTINSSGETFASDVLPPNTDPLKAFSTVTSNFCFEPSTLLNFRLRGVVELRNSGISCFSATIPQTNPMAFVTKLREDLFILRSESRSGNLLVQNESNFFFETRLMATTDLFRQLGLIREATMFVKEMCYPVTTSRCSTQVLNNLAVYLLDRGNPTEAVQLILDLLRRGDSDAALFQNLRLAVSALGDGALSLGRDDFERGILKRMRETTIGFH